MILQIYYIVEYPAKIPNPYQKNEIISDPIYTILGYDIILLSIKYFIRYIISFRPVINIKEIFYLSSLSILLI